MQNFGKSLRKIIILVLVVIIVYFVLANYSFVFSKNVKGQILEIERVTQTAIIGGNIQPQQLYSFAVAIRAQDGEILTASSEDRQWAIARKGFCVEAKFYPYPPWDFEKSGTYFNARLLKIVDCPAGTSLPTEQPIEQPAAPSSESTPGLEQVPSAIDPANPATIPTNPESTGL